MIDGNALTAEFRLKRPAADTGAVGLEVEPTEQFAGRGAGRGGRFGGKQLGEQGTDWGGPSRMMIAAGTARRPDLGLALGTGAQVVAVKLVEVGTGQAQFPGRFGGREFVASMLGQEVTEEGSR